MNFEARRQTDPEQCNYKQCGFPPTRTTQMRLVKSGGNKPFHQIFGVEQSHRQQNNFPTTLAVPWVQGGPAIGRARLWRRMFCKRARTDTSLNKNSLMGCCPATSFRFPGLADPLQVLIRGRPFHDSVLIGMCLFNVQAGFTCERQLVGARANHGSRTFYRAPPSGAKRDLQRLTCKDYEVS